MTELHRLLEGSDDPFERALLESGRADLPSPAGLHATALALGLTTTTASALASTLPAASSPGSALVIPVTPAVGSVGGSSGAVAGGAAGASGALGVASLGVLGKSLLGGALLSFLALTALDRTQLASPGRALAGAHVTRSVARVFPSSEEVSSPAAVIPPVSLADPRPTVAPSMVASRRSSTLAATAAPAAEARATPAAPAKAAFDAEPGPQASPAVAAANASLAAEIRLLDQARAALAAGDTKKTSQLLDAYAANRSSQTLAQEAALLRVRLLLSRGQRPAAAELARHIIAQHPESAHVESLRRLAAE